MGQKFSSKNNRSVMVPASYKNFSLQTTGRRWCQTQWISRELTDPQVGMFFGPSTLYKKQPTNQFCFLILCYIKKSKQKKGNVWKCCHAEVYKLQMRTFDLFCIWFFFSRLHLFQSSQRSNFAALYMVIFASSWT